jgi:hypothetical protein
MTLFISSKDHGKTIIRYAIVSTLTTVICVQKTMPAVIPLAKVVFGSEVLGS